MIMRPLRALRLALARLRMDGLFVDKFPPGHYYSPLPSWPPIESGGGIRSPVPLAVDLDIAGQLALVDRIKGVYGEIPPDWSVDSTHGSCRFRFRNNFFTYGDAIAYYGMIRLFSPRRVVEVGSGWSSAVLLDTDAIFLNGAVEKTFIDPDPSRLTPLLRPGDAARVIVGRVQDQPMELFTGLGAGDILFIDSSHVVKHGSDVLFLLAEVLPSLQPGVLVHLHDIPWPFEYPDVWFERGRAWNEVYFVKMLLQNTTAWQVMLFNSYLEAKHRDRYEVALPLALGQPRSDVTLGNSSLWLRRL